MALLYSRPYGNEARKGWVNIVTSSVIRRCRKVGVVSRGNNLECQTVCDIPSGKLFRVWAVGWVDVFFLLFLIAPSDLEILSCRSISHDVKFHFIMPIYEIFSWLFYVQENCEGLAHLVYPVSRLPWFPLLSSLFVPPFIVSNEL